MGERHGPFKIRQKYFSLFTIEKKSRWVFWTFQTILINEKNMIFLKSWIIFSRKKKSKIILSVLKIDYVSKSNLKFLFF